MRFQKRNLQIDRIHWTYCIVAYDAFRMKQLLLLFCVVCFAACYPNVTIGKTNCGMSVFVSKSEGDGGFPPSPVDGGIAWTMDSVNKAEAKTIELFNKPEVKDDRLKNACEKLNGLTLVITKKSVWNYNGKVVAGLAQCGAIGTEFPFVTVGTSKPSQTAFAHELAHFLQDCTPIGEQDIEAGESEEHAGWHEYGIYDALGWYWTQMELMGL